MLSNRFSRGTRALAMGAAGFLLSSVAWADAKIVSEVNLTGAPPGALSQMGESYPQTVTSYYKGDHLRMENKDGGVTLYDFAADKTFALDTKKKTYSTGPYQAMMQQFEPMSAMIKVDASGTVTPGDQTKTIAGLPAKNYVIHLVLNIGLRGQESAPLFTVHIDGEQWTTDAVKLSAGAQQIMTNSLLRNLGPMTQNMKPLMDKMSTIKGAGLASRMTITTTQSPLAGTTGATLDMTMTSEAKSVSQDPLDDALFKVPAGYTKADPPAAPGIGAGNPGL